MTGRLVAQSASADCGPVSRSPACVALKIRCRSRRTFSSWRRQSMASQSSRSSGPFTTSPPTSSAAKSTMTVVASCVVAPNLPIRFQRFVGSDSSKGHPAHVSTLSGPGTGPGMRPVIRGRPHVEGPVTRPRFPAAFRLPPFASWPSCPAPDIRLPCGRPTGGRSSPPDLSGVSMFRIGETRPVSGASCTPGPWCSHDRASHTGHHCRLPAVGPVLRWSFHLPKFWITRLTEIHLCSPFRPSPCL